MIKKILALLGVVALIVACNSRFERIPPLAVDLPASYKTDTAAYNFITHEVKVWNNFGKRVEATYRKADKFRNKEFEKLSPKEEYDLVKLDLEYALLWTTQDIYIEEMLFRCQELLKRVSEQGAGKVTEAQALITHYYYTLVQRYGKDLQLDKNPYKPDREEEE